MARARQQKHSQAELAAMAGVSVKTIREWKKAEGLDLADVKAVMLRAGKVDRPDDDSRGESYTEARRRRAVADANRAEIIAKRESGAVVEVAEVEALFNQIGAELRSRLLGWRSDLVHELEGRTGQQIHAALDKRICELLESIHRNSPVQKS